MIYFKTFKAGFTSSGSETAACVSLQERLGRPLLWVACRHHVGEVLLTHVWDALRIEVSKAPDVTVFVRYCGMSNPCYYRCIIA